MKSCVVILRKHKLNLLFLKIPRSLTQIFKHGRKTKSLLTSSNINKLSKQSQVLLQFPHTDMTINSNYVQ